MEDIEIPWGFYDGVLYYLRETDDHKSYILYKTVEDYHNRSQYKQVPLIDV